MAVQAISASPNKTVAASFFLRRLGMFISIQLLHLSTYDEIWDGDDERLRFGAVEEYGNRTVSMFVEKDDWRFVEERDHSTIIRNLLLQADAVIRKIRTVTSVSPLTLWENIFGFLLWQYHVMLSNPGTSHEARADMNILKNDETWRDIAPRSLFATYLQGFEPSELLNRTVRTTCCLSKDVPGLMQCGFCPLK